jgi:hypothetical protein
LGYILFVASEATAKRKREEKTFACGYDVITETIHRQFLRPP